MNFPRRRFFGSSLVLLGSSLLDALATPVWRWRNGLVLQSSVTPSATSPVQFVDVAAEAGLNVPNVWGGADHKRYIIEAKGSGLAFFDYDQDGWLDIYFTNGNRLGEKWPKGKEPTSQLFKNNRDGTFTNVTAWRGLAGKLAPVLATTTTTAGTTCFVASGDTTSCSTTTETGLLPT